MISENSKEVNVWEEKAKQCKARRALAQSRGVGIDTVSLRDVVDTPGGLEYWSSVTITIEASQVAKPKAKGKAKARASDGLKSLATIEKTLRGLVGHEMVIRKGTEDLKESQSADPVKWGWAAEYFAHCEAQEAVVFEIKTNGFVAKFMTSALSPESMKKLKKDSGDEYYHEVLRSVDALQKPVDEWAATVAKIKAMADAAGLGGSEASADNADTSAGGGKKKKQRK